MRRRSNAKVSIGRNTRSVRDTVDITVRSDSQELTLEIGGALASVLTGGDVLCLEGDLGAGKTVVVRGFARARGYEQPVPSPTFTIINPYPEIGLCHVDAFRLSGSEELLEAGMDEYLDESWVCAVEWAQKVRSALPARALEVTITFGPRDDDRSVRVRAAGGWDGKAAQIEKGLGRYA